MTTNLSRFEEDLKRLQRVGKALENNMYSSCHPESFKEALKSMDKAKVKQIKDEMAASPFDPAYQAWYSEALALIRQVLPDRVNDFVRLYEKPKGRKEVTFESYRIEDYLQGLRTTRGGETITGPSAAIPALQQQCAILGAARQRFKSSLFDITHLVTADLLDSELEAAETLAKHKFTRAAGAVSGVVLERHLGQVCSDHACTPSKKNPTIADFNEALKAGGTLDIATWRFIQHLADIRNMCDHSKIPEPTVEQVNDLVAGVKKITKTVF